MIRPKQKSEVQKMVEGGKKLAAIKEVLRRSIAPGITPKELDQKAEKLILRAGGKPSFKMVKNYHWATCININEGVVHGIPNDRPLKEGDIVSVDVGFFHKGFHTDTSFTAPVGKMSGEVKRFLDTGREALRQAISRARAGSNISSVSKAIQDTLEAKGYSPVRALTGHGIGKNLHEEPQVPCFWTKDMKDEEIPKGAVLAIEVIYTLGSPELVLDKDGWTIVTKDGRIAGLFEETVAAVKDGPLILTE